MKDQEPFDQTSRLKAKGADHGSPLYPRPWKNRPNSSRREPVRGADPDLAPAASPNPSWMTEWPR